MTCKSCIHYKACCMWIHDDIGRSLYSDIECKNFEDKSNYTELPAIAMINQHLVNGKFVSGNLQRHNGKYAVVYLDKSKWGTPLIDICGTKYYNQEEAQQRLEELKKCK